MFQTALTFAGLVARDALGQRDRVSDHEQHLRAAEDWLKRAHDQNPDDGVSYGYSIRGGWRPSYRETSGYIATTFFAIAQYRDDADFRQRALRICRWLLGVQNADGSFSNPRYGDEGIVFDTGQALFGLVRAFEVAGDAAFRHAAIRAARWLVDIADTKRCWSRNEHLNTPHVYNTRTAWALLRANQIAPCADFESVARANLDWALVEQQPSGFFAHCGFERGATPFTHTIAYTARGLLESGILLGDGRYVDAARRCADAAVRELRADGFMPGQIAIDGTATASYCCLTGNCQFSIVWTRLSEIDKNGVYLQAANRALIYVMGHQDISTRNPDVRGAIKGSHPIWGKYAPLSFPNWATKFFVDAMWLLKK